MCIDAHGTVWVAWEDSRSGQQQAWLRSSRPGDLGQPISESAESTASVPTIASGKDVVGVAYESQNKTEKTIRFHLVEDSQ